MSTPVSLNLGDHKLWTPYKTLLTTLARTVNSNDVDQVPDLAQALRNHKPDFICLLKNPAKGQVYHDALMRASTTGIAVTGQTGMQILSSEVVKEASIISEMFALNELTSLELLIAGQLQQHRYLDLNRGLVAVLLYYDGRRSLVNSLRLIVQMQEGKTWTFELASELTSVLTNFAQQLKEEGLIMRVIDLIETMDIKKEMELLNKNRALGAPRYRKQVMDLILEIGQSLSETVFFWACQSTLSCEEAMRLLTYLSTCTIEADGGCLDDSTLTLTFALLYVMDVGVLMTLDELDANIKKLNLMNVPELAVAIHKKLSSDTPWQIPGLKAIFRFAWGISLRLMSQHPTAASIVKLDDGIEDDERIIKQSIDDGAFEALINLVVHSPLFHKEEFYIKRIHNLVADFITLMPVKLKEIRTQGEESAKIVAAYLQQGLEPPTNLPMHFQQFLTLLGKVYSGNPLDLNLALDYWCPTENHADEFYTMRASQRQVSLFKFVRIAGNLLPPPLFVPYHQMLKSLSSSKFCAHHCFNLLKMNCRQGNYYSIVSWDHFFATLHNYYNNLREEVAITVDSHQIYRQKMLTKGITPQEVQGLCAVLELITEIVKSDEVALLTLAESSQYAPCVVLFGLITCSVPPLLKASLIKCIAAFASASIVAFDIWQGIEANQVIPTLQTTNIYHPSGILMEIEDVETRNEEYPITTAILELLNALLQHPFPTSIGTGHRAPGLQPYLDFVRDKVLLRWSSRSYKSQKEKWKILALCLNILGKVLCDYKDATDIHSPMVNRPGYSILAEMFQDSKLLKVLLSVLDEGIEIMDMYNTFDGQSELEESTLLTLEMIYNALSKQDAFMQQVRNQSSSHLLITSLDNLLLGINPRSGQADYLLIISRYITHNSMNLQHSLLSLQILLILLRSTSVEQHLASIYDTREGDALLHGMVECLENEEGYSEESTGEETQDARCKAQQLVLILLLNCLPLPSPNISHYLLGFHTQQPITQTEIQEPGVLGSKRTCLHAVISMLENGLSNVYKAPSVVNLAYQLIYSLCANKDTSGPVLRYLRSTHDLFYRHLSLLPLKVNEGKHYAKLLSLQSWLLRALAIELRVTSAHHQHSHVQRLLMSFLDDKPSTLSVGSGDSVTEAIPGLSNTMVTSSATFNAGPVRRKLMCILDSLDLQHDECIFPQWEHFDSEQLQKLFKECEVQESSGPSLINIKQLHQRLLNEINVLHDVAGAQSRLTMFQQEINLVLEHAHKFNDSSHILFAKKQAFSAWRQVTEVLLLACPLNILGNDKKRQIVLEVSQELLLKIKSENFLQELMGPASGIMLTLMAALRHSVKSSQQFSLEPNATLAVNAPILLGQHSLLLVVLKSIIECLLQNGSRLQAVRANLYGALLNLLCIVEKPSECSGVESAILDDRNENRKLRTGYIETILSFGEPFMDIICRDACTSHDITKMLSLAVLDVMISLDVMVLDNQRYWVSYLISKGYLRHILDSLSKDDEQLQDLLSRNSNSYRTFYVFESKMSLLARIGSTAPGALALLQHGAIFKLGECGSINVRPDMYLSAEKTRSSENWILPDLNRCYQQIVKAIMKLILSIVMALEPYHRDCSEQLLGYIAYHADFFVNILRDCTGLDDEARLEELSLVTAVLTRVPLTECTDEYQGQLLLLRQHLLVLLQCIFDSDSFRQSAMASRATASSNSGVKVAQLQIAANILGMCCDTVNKSDFRNSSAVLFGPLLNEASSSAYFSRKTLPIRPSPVPGRAPDLSLIVAVLHQCCSQFHSSHESYKFLLKRSQSVSTLTNEEIAEYLPSDMKIRHTSQRQQELAQKCLKTLLQFAEKQESILSYMIETSAFILLRHLEHYLRASTSSETQFSSPSIAGIGSPRVSVQTKNKFTQNVVLTPQELQHFKSQVLLIISDAFFQEISAVQKHLSRDRSHVSFLEAIVNRIKRIVRFKT